MENQVQRIDLFVPAEITGDTDVAQRLHFRGQPFFQQGRGIISIRENGVFGGAKTGYFPA